VVAGKSIVFDEFAVDHFRKTPALETLDVAQPHRLRHARLGKVLIKDLEEMAKSESDIPEVVYARCFVVFIETDDGMDHLIVDWERL